MSIPERFSTPDFKLSGMPVLFALRCKGGGARLVPFRFSWRWILATGFVACVFIGIFRATVVYYYEFFSNIICFYITFIVAIT